MLKTLDGISERLIGWCCIAGTVTEYISPDLLAVSAPQAAGVGLFGILLATGRADAAVRRGRRMLGDD